MQRNTALAGLVAPDFTLPDLAGVPHTLSALRGKKVFLRYLGLLVRLSL